MTNEQNCEQVNSDKRGWMVDYCKSRGVSPYLKINWEFAEKAYENYRERSRTMLEDMNGTVEGCGMVGYSVVQYIKPHASIFNLNELYPEVDSYYFNLEAARSLLDYVEKKGVKGAEIKKGWSLYTAGMEIKSPTKEQIEDARLQSGLSHK